MEGVIYMTTGELIKKRRKELGMSVEDLAKKTGKHIATVYRWERGDIDDWPVDTLIAIAAALNIAPSGLLGNMKEGDIITIDNSDALRRDYLFKKYGTLMSDLDGMSEEDQKQVEQFIKFKMLQQSDE